MMANQENIVALERLLEKFDAELKPFGTPRYRAEWLAERGVLVPSTLSDDQAVKIGADAVGILPQDPAEIALCVRQGLERIARGEG
jgi:hypothetical protein